MGKVKGEDKELATVKHLLAEARTVDEFYGIMNAHGFSLIDSRLWDVLEDLPVGLDDLVEDDEEDEDEDE